MWVPYLARYTTLTVDRSKAFPEGIVGHLTHSSPHPSGAPATPEDGDSVTPLRFPNNQPVRDLHTLIENWEEVHDKLLTGTPVEKLEEIEFLAPLRGRDVLCVGYNYRNHRM